MSDRAKCPECIGTEQKIVNNPWKGKTTDKCPSCDGKGYHHDEPKAIEDCAKCDGTGEVEPDRTKCPTCKGAGGYTDHSGVYSCEDCSGTGEVESFWTTTPPTEPGWYFAIHENKIEPEIVEVFKGDHDDFPDMFEVLVMGQSDCAIYLEDFEYWSREPIRFPDPPQEQGDE